MKFKPAVPDDPFAKSRIQPQRGAKTAVSGSNDFYGANSLESFSSASGLTYTHEDADGFLDYPTSFAGKAANYWRKDAGVKVWAYEETYDNWQDTFGMDAVLVFYHSGHGNMNSKGVFEAPLGGTWDGRDWAYSNRMAFANEELRYLFWSTCFSLRVSGANNPVRTWWDANKGGLRMMFGYETTSIDDPNYGKNFWEEWKKGKAFGRAFLDASWRISHGQVPVVMAAGANAAQAIDRLNNERYFSRAPSGKGWYQWQWIGTLPSRSFASRLSTPKKMDGLILGNKFVDVKTVAKIALESGVTQRNAGTILFDENGNRRIASKDVQVNVSAEGALNLHFGKANVANTVLIDESKAIKAAQQLISGLGLDKGIELKLGNIRHRLTCGGTMQGSGLIEKPSAIETIVQFRQSHGGIESINSDHGLIAVGIDNDGRVVDLYDSTRAVLGELPKRGSNTASPKDPKGASPSDIGRQFKKKIERIAPGKGVQSSTLRELVGYDFSGKIGSVVHQKDVEVAFAKSLKKRYKVRVPVM